MNISSSWVAMSGGYLRPLTKVEPRLKFLAATPWLRAPGAWPRAFSRVAHFVPLCSTASGDSVIRSGASRRAAPRSPGIFHQCAQAIHLPSRVVRAISGHLLGDFLETLGLVFRSPGLRFSDAPVLA